MNKFDIAGRIEMNGERHTVEYDSDSMVGGGTLFLRAIGTKNNVPIHIDHLDDAIEMLNRMKNVIAHLER